MPKKHKPVELTASAQAKLEAARRRGALGNIRKTTATKQARLGSIMGQINRNRGR